MSGKYQAYPEYKDSGVEWLGLIPTDWELWKLTHAYEEIGSGTTPPSGSDEWYGGDVPWVTTGELRETEIVSTTKSVTEETLRRFPTLRKYPKSSIAIAMYGATIGRLGIFGIEATTNQACCVLTKSAVIDNKYLYYWLQAFKPDIVNLASGGGQPNINQEVVASLKISSPEVSGQKKIANFLDHETAKIDTLIEKQQQLIALLKEKHQAVISHAVTKGLNANAPMRDSGVEWLGEVPEHWEVCMIKHKCLEITDGAHVSPETEGGEQYFVSITDIKKGVINFKNALLTTPASYEYLVKTGCMPFAGDILFSKDGTIGQTAITPEGIDFVVASSLIIIRPDRTRVTPEYLDFLLQSGVVVEQVESFVKGAALRRLSIQNLLKIGGAFPPINEQMEISNYLTDILNQYDDLEVKANDLITLQVERRTALISAAVTGKIDVRNWQAPQLSNNDREAV
jgi:type I restriction enzyme S subunit